MIHRVDERLEAWASGALGKEKAEIRFDAPAAEAPGKRSIGFHLLEILPTPAPRTPKRPPLQLTLRYLVTVAAEKPADAHRLLGDLAFAAMDQADFDVEAEPLTAQAWIALGVPLRPSFVLRLPLRKERPEPPVHRVRFPLVIRNAPMRPYSGQVVGPGDVPIAAARVESPDLGQAVETDFQGRFHFPGVPAGMPLRRLRVLAKGLAVDVDVAATTRKNEPFVIRMDALEE